MNKLVILLITLMIVSIGFLSGCNEQEQNNHQTDTNNLRPVAECSSSINKGLAPLMVQFTGSGIDADGTIVSYHWDFDDGTTSTEQNPSHTFQTDGHYLVFLTVTDNDGKTDSTYINIYVEESTSQKDDSAYLNWVQIVTMDILNDTQMLEFNIDVKSFSGMEEWYGKLENDCKQALKEIDNYVVSPELSNVKYYTKRSFEELEQAGYYGALGAKYMNEDYVNTSFNHLDLGLFYINKANDYLKEYLEGK